MAEEPVYIDDDHAAIAGFAEAYLDEDERADFVDQLMERRGYQRVSSWAAPEAPEEPAPRTRQPVVRNKPQPAQQQRKSPYFKR